MFDLLVSFFLWKKEASLRSEIVTNVNSWCVILITEQISGSVYSVKLGCCN